MCTCVRLCVSPFAFAMCDTHNNNSIFFALIAAFVCEVLLCLLNPQLFRRVYVCVNMCVCVCVCVCVRVCLCVALM